MRIAAHPRTRRLQMRPRRLAIANPSVKKKNRGYPLAATTLSGAISNRSPPDQTSIHPTSRRPRCSPTPHMPNRAPDTRPLTHPTPNHTPTNAHSCPPTLTHAPATDATNDNPTKTHRIASRTHPNPFSAIVPLLAQQKLLQPTLRPSKRQSLNHA